MILTLRIENRATLEDGGPTWLTLDGRGASVGRRAAMDWVLPDPSRHISGHHFDISFRDGVYYLSDVSTNGTYFENSFHRLQGPVALSGGERLRVGAYIISVQLAQSPVAVPQQSGVAPPVALEHDREDHDPWDFGDPVGASVPQPAPVVVPRPPAGPALDFGNDFIPLQRPDPAPPQPRPAGLSMPPGGVSVPSAALMGAPGLQRPTPPPGADHAVLAPLPSPPAMPLPSSGGGAVWGAPALTPEAQPTSPAPVPPVPGQASTPSAGFVTAFCRGAGLNPALATGPGSEALAQALGESLRVVVDETMRMLRDRAAVKQFTKGGERTMRSATRNNPLKFMPDEAQALEAMFLAPRDGFMAGPEALDAALKDLRAHQMGVFAALQPALAAVLEGLSPEEITQAETTGNLLSGSRKARLWDEFVKRWDHKAQEGDHGMLDVFLQAFAKAYAEANTRQS